jgi:hypothetical protein
MVLMLGGLPAVAQSLGPFPNYEAKEVKFTVVPSETVNVSTSRTGNHLDRVVVRIGSGEDSRCAVFSSDASVPGLFLFQGRNSADDRVVIVKPTCQDCGDETCPPGQVPYLICQTFIDSQYDMDSYSCQSGDGTCEECEVICKDLAPSPPTPHCTTWWEGQKAKLDFWIEDTICGLLPCDPDLDCNPW